VSKLTNKETSAENFNKHIELFKCPLCGSNMEVKQLTSLVCRNNHSFDFAKQGYVNLLTHHVKTKYDKELFESRRKLMDKDHFYQPVIQSIVELILKTINVSALTILDTGCGDGAHLSNISNDLTAKDYSITGVGIDIAKEGVLVAARHNPENMWCVADLANTPFMDKKFDVILNLLSPSNYGEFHRLLMDDGILIKAVPQKDYLKEIREAFYGDTDKKHYSNDDIVDHFKDHFQLIDKIEVKYTVTLNNTSLESVVEMTPLSWGMTPEQIQSFINKGSENITVHLDILIGKK
jgi:23S rRNA (guanine745-N1)-methyltransferase